jgi:predicted transposase YdaD
MRFINPKTDFGFKRIFGSLQSHPILVSFLNSILIANEVNLSADELEELEKREIFIHDQRNAIKLALKRGRQEGEVAGLREGRRTTQQEIAKGLLAMLDDGAIAQVTGLSVQEIQALRAE